MHVSPVSLGVLSVASVIFLAGSGVPPRADAGGAPAPQLTASKSEVRTHMDEHFGKASEVQAAVVRGDIAGAKDSARWIAEHQETPGLPASGKASVDEMKKAARSVAEASDIKAAAQGSAGMALACGSCHASSNAKPAFPPATKPTPRSRTMAHMLAHQHAVNLLYQGLVGPSDEAWAEGANALKAAPLSAAATPKPPKPSPEAAKAEADTHALADKAAAAKDPKERSGIYAELVSGCASCHALYGRVLGEGVPKK